MSLRILIVNTVALNAGDAAILEGEVRALREAYGGDVRITIADDDPAAASRLYPALDFVPGFHEGRRRGLSRGDLLARSARRRRRALALRLLARAPSVARGMLDPEARQHLERIEAADLVIATGGTYLVEHYPLGPRVAELRAAQALGKPTYLYTQSLGPFTGPRSRRLVGPALRAADGLFLRDERSRQHVRDLGVPAGRTTVCPDAAFVLAEVPGEAPGTGARPSGGAPAAERPAPATGRPVPGDAAAPDAVGHPLRVAVSVRHWRHFRGRSPEDGLRSYREAVAEAVRLLHARGAEVTFLSTCQGVEEYWTDDSRFARAIVQRHLAGLERVRVDDSFRTPTELVAHLREFDMAIATRMHFAILALCAGVPVLPISYEFKTAELFAGLGMAEWVEEIDTITADTLCVRMCELLADLPAVRERCRAAVPALREGAAEPARVIRAAHPPRDTEAGP